MILHERDFERISAHAKAGFALNLDYSKRQMVSRRLAARVREVGLADFSQYADYLDKNAAERASLTSTLTTNTTHFFREGHHFDMMMEKWLPDLIVRARAGGRVRIWSAASSNGQEPYSIAMTVLNACPEAANLDIHILATDIDQTALDRAKLGRYTKEEIADIPGNLQKLYFAESGGAYTVRDAVKNIVSFGRLNLPADWPFSGSFDIIFCRNVAIYFDSDTQKTLWSRMSQILNPGGLLCIGHSERIVKPTLISLTSLGNTAYHKCVSEAEK